VIFHNLCPQLWDPLFTSDGAFNLLTTLINIREVFFQYFLLCSLAEDKVVGNSSGSALEIFHFYTYTLLFSRELSKYCHKSSLLV